MKKLLTRVGNIAYGIAYDDDAPRDAILHAHKKLAYKIGTDFTIEEQIRLAGGSNEGLR